MSRGLTDYGRRIAPSPMWGDEELTFDDLVENRLVLALEALTCLGESLREPPMNGAMGEARSRYRMMLRTIAKMYLVEVELLETVRQLAPRKADKIAREHSDRFEEDGYAEELAMMLAERGIDPDQVMEETRAELAAEVFDWRSLT